MAERKRPTPKGAPKRRPAAVKTPRPAVAPAAPHPATTTGRRTDGTFPIVGVGASAGGLEALQRLFKDMPADCGQAFVVVQHLAPDHKSLLPELMAKFTALPVHEVTDGLRVEKNHIYIIPPDTDLALLNGRLQLIDPVEPRGHRHPIDFFLRSLAQDRGDSAACIVLSGTGSEGSLGIKAIKEEGGVVLVQDPATAAYDGMPKSAVATGQADLVLAPEEMAEALQRFANGRGILAGPSDDSRETAIPSQLQKIFVLLRARTGHDLSFYKQNTILRRIEKRMALHRIANIDSYIHYLRETPAEAGLLFKELLIGVTNFFRDPAAFDALRNIALPALFENRPAGEGVRIWVAGCSTGEEAYSVAMLVQDYMDRNDLNYPVQVFATDIDAAAIDKARAGAYPATIATAVPEDYLKRYFTADKGTYRIRKSIRDMLVYAEQNLIKDAPFSRLDLITCRNLLIYIGSELQKRVPPLFHYALKPNGFLLLGTSESVGEASDLFAAVDRKQKLFQRRPGARAETPRFGFTATLPKGESDGPDTPAVSPNQPIGYRAFIEKALLSDFTPACVIVNRRSEILYVHGRTGSYLEPATGRANLNLLAMAREGLQGELAGALHTVFHKGVVVQRKGLRVKTGGAGQMVSLTVKPIDESGPLQGLAMVLFEAMDEPGNALAAPAADEARRIEELGTELRSTKEYLQTAIEELETANEELKSTNEELQSSNEELQSTNEEHETAKEEMQSVNEELVTVNAELESKLTELAKVNDDMANLMASTNIGTVFLDLELRIVRFTPAATRVVNLIATDVGRPFGLFVTTLDYANLQDDTRQVLDTLVPTEREARTGDGEWYLIRVTPYRTTENVINGLVITFFDITDRKRLEAASRLATVVRDANDAVTVQDFTGTILAWNHGAEVLYGIGEAQALGSNIAQTVPAAQRAELALMVNKIRAGERVVNFETSRLGRDGNTVRVWLTASLLHDDTGKAYAIATTERDITWLAARKEWKGKID